VIRRPPSKKSVAQLWKINLVSPQLKYFLFYIHFFTAKNVKGVWSIEKIYVYLRGKYYLKHNNYGKERWKKMEQTRGGRCRTGSLSGSPKRNVELQTDIQGTEA
jgi:hypothetical protein